jgi:hypothetical protein
MGMEDMTNPGRLAAPTMDRTLESLIKCGRAKVTRRALERRANKSQDRRLDSHGLIEAKDGGKSNGLGATRRATSCDGLSPVAKFS